MSLYRLVPGFVVRWMARRVLAAEAGWWASVGRSVERRRGPGWRDDLRLGLGLHERGTGRNPRFASGGTIAPPSGDSDFVPVLLERGCVYITVRDDTGRHA